MGDPSSSPQQQVVLPSFLVNALKRLAAQEAQYQQQIQTSSSSPKNPVGLLLGTKSFGDDTSSSVPPKDDPHEDELPHQVAIWSLVRSLETYDELEACVPGGIVPVGYLVIDSQSESPDQIAQKAKETLQTQSFLGHEWRVVLVFCVQDQSLHFFQCVQHEHCAPIPARIVDCFHAQDFHKHLGVVPIRCRLKLSLSLAHEDLFDDQDLMSTTTSTSSSTKDDDNLLERKVQQVKTQLTSRKTSCFFMKFPFSEGLFRLDGTNLLQPKDKIPSLQQVIQAPLASKKKQNKSKKKSNLSAADQVAAVLDSMDQDAKDKDQTQALNDQINGCFPLLETIEYGSIRSVVLVQTLDPVVAKKDRNGTGICAPWVGFNEPLQSTMQQVHLHCDVLAFEQLNAPVTQAIQTLMRQLCLQLDAFVMKHAGNSMVRHWFCDHFALLGTAHPLTRIHVESSNPKRAQQERMQLHETLLQPLDKPLLLPICTLANHHQQLAQLTPVLFNVHEAMANNNSGVPNGTKWLVQGSYGYFHYLQDNFNDKGWGCAYRSLQTLASWFYLNHYTDLAKLSHKKIQQTLVKIGDKPTSFVDSRDWIGSMEVGFVLDELFGVSFRSLNAPNGGSLGSLARELAQHFASQGTPVMMGGGQLAFTILGLDWNEQTGDVAFLILDPHYCGNEDLTKITTQTIQLEGYKAIPCSWRKPTSFAKDSFYNLCLPQRPHMV